mmetsp:Transcript_86206/g.279028  ORF Transcript_86206/g.279028 Transcript_86206/m.279028 type:complete len:204 (-) Transcript_86206:624-1235(-)
MRSNLPMRPSTAALPGSAQVRFRRSSARSLYCSCRLFSCRFLSSVPSSGRWKTFSRQRLASPLAIKALGRPLLISSAAAPSSGRFRPPSRGASLAMSLSSILILRGPTVRRLPLFSGPTHCSFSAKPSSSVPSSEVPMSQTKKRSCSEMILQCACASLAAASWRQSASRSGQHLPMMAPVASTLNVHALFPQGGGLCVRRFCR